MKSSLTKLLLLGVALEIVILLVSHLLHPEVGETFRFSARYSGRLSAMVFLYAFYQYAIAFPRPVIENERLLNFLKLFALLHIIHFGFLASNVYLNSVPLEGIKLIGGALAYLMIVVAPFKLHKLSIPLQLIYFYYVGLVMILTYVARIKGDFEGAESSWIHYLGAGTLLLCCFGFALLMRRSAKNFQS